MILPILEFSNTHQFEKGLLLNLLGLLDLVEKDLITTIEAEKYLFNSFRNDRFKDSSINSDILEILSESGFLDDAKRLGEASFERSCENLRKVILQALDIRRGTPLTVRITGRSE